MIEWLSRVNQVWLSRIRHAEKVKERVFGETAKKLWGFLTREYSELYCQMTDEQDRPFPVDDGPMYKPRLNLCQEFVDVYAPLILAQSPTRVVSVDRPQFPEEVYRAAMPMMMGEGGPQGGPQMVPYAMFDDQLRAGLQTGATLQNWWLNYTPREYKQMREARLALKEGLVKGRGVCWHSMMKTGSLLLPVSFYDTVDNLLVDPDSSTMRDAGYVVRRRDLPTWLASRVLGIEEKKLIGLAKKQRDKGGKPIVTSDEDVEDDGIDRIQYYEVWSRIGIGHVLATDEDTTLAPLKESLDAHGEHVWLAICEGASEPLNLDPDLLLKSESEIKAAIEWPIQTFGKIADPWPCSILDFKPNSDNAWASSPMAPGLPMQVFQDHLYGYIMSRVRNACRTILLLANECPEELITTLRGGKDLGIVRIPREQLGKLAGEMYEILEIPPLKREVWELLDVNAYYFQKAVGLDPALSGSRQTESRSAAESKIRQGAVSGRARDMGNQVDTWMGSMAQKEGILTRLQVGPQHIHKFLGEPFQPEAGIIGPLTNVWANLVNVPDGDPYAAAEDFAYNIVSGSGREKNKESQREDIMTLAQTVLPVVMQTAGKMAEAGMPGAFEKYNEFIRKLSESLDTDLGTFRMDSPVMPAMPPAGPEAQGQGQPQPQVESSQ